MAIGAKTKNPERVLMVYDLLRNDPEVYHLFCYGIEGQQYIVGSDGKTITNPEGFNSDTDSINFNYWWGRNDSLEFFTPNYEAARYQVLADAYEKVAIPYPYGKLVFNIDPVMSEISNLNNIYSTYMLQIVFGKASDPAAYVAEFREQLKNAGYEKVAAEVQSQLSAAYK
jgi:hypothetical protein